MLSSTIHHLFAKASSEFPGVVLRSASLDRLIPAALDETSRWQRRRRALLAPLMMQFVLMMVLFRPLAIPNVFLLLVNLLRRRSRACPRKPVTDEALHHARARLGAAPFEALFRAQADAIRPEPSFHGLRTWAVDGVRFRTQDTPANEEAFGRPRASRGVWAFPQLRAVALVDTTSRRIRACEFDQCTAAERPAAERLIASLGDRDLVLLDRGFAAVWLFQGFIQRGVHFLCRLPLTWKVQRKVAMGPGDWIVQVAGLVPLPAEIAARSTRKNKTIRLRLRMVEYRIGRGRQVVRLATDLCDFGATTAHEIALLYHERWECELAYDEIKTHLATVPHGTLHTPFRSKTPEGVLQEAYAVVVTYNLIRGVMAEAGSQHGVPAREISFVATLVLLSQALSWPPSRDAYRGLLADVAACRLTRSRRKRVCPRKVKVKMSEFRLKRPSDHAMARDFASELKLLPNRAHTRKAA